MTKALWGFVGIKEIRYLGLGAAPRDIAPRSLVLSSPAPAKEWLFLLLLMKVFYVMTKRPFSRY
jgi:hypothetical protein